MENKTKVSDVFTAFGEVFSAFFGKQEDNKMLKDLSIFKGLKNGIGYVIYIVFVLPLKILAFILKPSWSWVHFTRRHLVSPIFEIESLTGSESPSRLLGEIYEDNLNYFKGKQESGIKSSHLKPSISILERLMIFAKVRVIITLLLFTVGAFELYDLFEEVLIAINGVLAFITALIGVANVSISPTALNGMDGVVGGVTFGVIMMWAVWIIGGALIAYIAMFAIRFFVESVKSVMYADRQMLKDFVDDSLHYTITKSIELYGEDMALKAYDLLLENVVVEQERYTADEPHYKKLTHKKEDAKLLDDSKDGDNDSKGN